MNKNDSNSTGFYSTASTYVFMIAMLSELIFHHDFEKDLKSLSVYSQKMEAQLEERVGYYNDNTLLDKYYEIDGRKIPIEVDGRKIEEYIR